MKRKRGLGSPDLTCDRSKIMLSRERLNSGGYDSGGRYFGQGEPLFSFSNDSSSGYVRASSRAAAKAKLRAKCPGARFFR